jgi:hypothetical protein
MLASTQPAAGVMISFEEYLGIGSPVKTHNLRPKWKVRESTNNSRKMNTVHVVKKIISRKLVRD